MARILWIRTALDWMHRQPSKQADIVSVIWLTPAAVLFLCGPIIALADWYSMALSSLVIPVQIVRLAKLEDARWRCMMAVAATVVGLAFVAEFYRCHLLFGVFAGFALVANDFLTVTRFSLWVDQLSQGVPNANRRFSA